MASHYAEKTESPKKKSNNKIIFLFIGVVFFVFVIFSTIYSVANYPKSLPPVSIISLQPVTIEGKTYQNALPKAAVRPDSAGTYSIYTVEQKDGPWGYEYLIRSNGVMTKDEWYNGENELVPVFFPGNAPTLPIVLSKDDFIYDGLRVRLTE